MKTSTLSLLALLATFAVGCAETPRVEDANDSSAAETANESGLDGETARRGAEIAMTLVTTTAEPTSTMRIASSDKQFDFWRYDVFENGFRLTAAVTSKFRTNKVFTYALETKDGETRLIGMATGDDLGQYDAIDAMLTTARADLESARTNNPELEDPTSGQGLEGVKHPCSDYFLTTLRSILAGALTVDAAGAAAQFTGVAAIPGGIALLIAAPVTLGTGFVIDLCMGPKEQGTF